ncbi:Mth938-like domain-containing protein [Radicibacter daui]|uniref:Mth938-like domain-containing protein n=1 Tax=Radicibacter daui TaxID=3064829 RepID=UPI0040469187
MDLNLAPVGDGKVIHGYGDGGFRVSADRYEGSLIVTRDTVLPLTASRVSDIDAEALAAVLAADSGVEVMLLGCGQRMEMVPKALKEAFRARGIGIEPMDTGAACRTFNVLLSEDRRVAAALIAV